MPTPTLKAAASWILTTAMVALFVTASWHLANGASQGRIEGLMSGGCLMFGAVAVTWLRLWVATVMAPAGGHMATRWASVMDAEPV